MHALAFRFFTISFLNILVFCVSAFAAEAFKPSLESLVQKNYFASQEDPYLMGENPDKYKWALDDGGLCGPTSAHILLDAIDFSRGKSNLSRSVLEIIRLTELATEITKEDARFGLYTGDLTDVLIAESKSRNSEIVIKSASHTFGDGASVVWSINSKLLERLSKKSIFIFGAKVYEIKNGKPEFLWDHFMVGYDFDSVNNRINIIEPLHPKFVIKGTLKKSKELSFPYKETFRISYDKRLPDQKNDWLIYLTSVIGVDY